MTLWNLIYDGFYFFVAPSLPCIGVGVLLILWYACCRALCQVIAQRLLLHVLQVFLADCVIIPFHEAVKPKMTCMTPDSSFALALGLQLGCDGQSLAVGRRRRRQETWRCLIHDSRCTKARRLETDMPTGFV